ncbi:hypothetical protein NMG60_11024386 [Bertholletia excelsa]
MASSGGNSSGSTRIQTSGSEEAVMDQRKRKRMQSNRESARRSRMRKRKLLDDLTAQVAQLREENHRILTSMSLVSQQHLGVETENSILRAQAAELSQRLESLNDILGCMNAIPSKAVFGFGDEDPQPFPDSIFNNSWNLGCLSQPIMTSPEMFLY